MNNAQQTGFALSTRSPRDQGRSARTLRLIEPAHGVSRRRLDEGEFRSSFLARISLRCPYRRTPKNQRMASNVTGTPNSQRMNAFPMV